MAAVNQYQPFGLKLFIQKPKRRVQSRFVRHCAVLQRQMMPGLFGKQGNLFGAAENRIEVPSILDRVFPIAESQLWGDERHFFLNRVEHFRSAKPVFKSDLLVAEIRKA